LTENKNQETINFMKTLLLNPPARQEADGWSFIGAYYRLDGIIVRQERMSGDVKGEGYSIQSVDFTSR
jgi:hypothetical protein